jgi:hypothetical protein
MPFKFDIHTCMSVRRNIIPKLHPRRCNVSWFIFTDVVHVSVGPFAHHQEHITLHTALGTVNCNDIITVDNN